MHLKNVAAAFFALTLGEVSHAYEGAPGAVHPEYSLPFSYGKCYHLKNHNDEYIGHQGGPIGYLLFGHNANTAIFKVCANTHICESNRQIEGVQAGEEWYLRDMEGSTLSKGPAYVVGGKPGFLYPAWGLNKNYLQFSALNERSSYSDRSVRLHAHDSTFLMTTGLSIVPGVFGDHIMTAYSNEGILIDFEEVNCPPY
ncbi:unnamed protein product [Penicillium salamii]|nr:unnamed protein product [Penicillium salamii]CAG8411566.1 unnamed protein product [Penicillium salamii]